MSRLAILGASGHGKVVADAAESAGWTHIDFFDDAWPACALIGVWSCVGATNDLVLKVSAYDGVVVAIGNNSVRETKLRELSSANAPIVSVVHPRATVSRYCSIGKGCVVLAGVQVNPGAEVGDGAILNTGCSVDHDCLIGASVHISPGAHLAGGVQIGDRTWIGIGACIKQLVRVGADVIVGAGAAVISDVPAGQVVAGVPATQIK